MFCRSNSISVCALHEMRKHISDASCEVVFYSATSCFVLLFLTALFFTTHKNKVEFKMPDLKWHLSILFLSTFLCFSKPIFCVWFFFIYFILAEHRHSLRLFLFPIFFYSFIVFVFGHIHVISICYLTVRRTRESKVNKICLF